MTNKILERFKEYVNSTQFNAMRVSIASPAKIIALSYGEIKKIETINYRTLKPERDGLFCARIFGPMKDWECNCGKYKRMKHRGVTCEKCGVEVIQARVRRERMGHINLVSKVCHIWYLKGIPSYLSLMMDMTVRDIEKIIYFDTYVVINQGASPFVQKSLLTAQEYDQYIHENPEDIQFKADMGAEAIHLLLSAMDLLFIARKAQDEYAQTASVAQKHRFARRYKLLMDMHNANIRPEWMILSALPVIPPDLRPLVPIEGGRFASSDLNDLYRRVLNRNIRLQRLIELEAPDVMIKNERRMLQESVDALIDNGRRGQPVRGSNKRPLKSLSEMLRGKQGRFRQNLLGKRVDYSGRSVIVVDPELQLHQCGLPKLMALELFKPYVYIELQRRELALNLRAAKRMVEEQVAEVWEALEFVVKGRPVLLNRAPTLHRLSIQAFYPTLVEGKAIKIHPLVCAAYNADFDGDQMAVHVPLSQKAQKEAITLMLSTNNILTAASGRPIMVPSQDMVLGLYYMTKCRKNVLGQGLIFSSVEEVVYAYQYKKAHLQASVKLRLRDGRMVDTTVGRILLYEKLPSETEFEWINKAMAKKDLIKLISKVHRVSSSQKTVIALDNIKRLGFSYATLGGISLCIDDLLIPGAKKTVIERSKKEVEQAEKLYRDGIITNGERTSKVIQIWFRATEEITNEMIGELEAQDRRAYENINHKNTPFNPVYIMLDSGARGTRQQIRQLGGMRGLMSKPSGETMETPVLANFKDGLNVFEYFISTHGARKGLADTALRTADSGYLTRRLVDVAQDVVVTKLDCGTLGYINVSALQESGVVIETLEDRVFGRVAAEAIIDPVSGKVIASSGDVINEEIIALLKESAVTEVAIRSVLTCHAARGICVRCYGLDLSLNELVDIGSAVGIIAAQSIGEPGTQLTMRTFHVGGVASGVGEKTHLKSKYNGRLQYRGVHTIKNRDGALIVMNRKAKIAIVSEDGRELEVCDIEYGSRLLIADGIIVSAGEKIADWDLFKVIMTEKTGKVQYVDLIENVTFQEYFDEASGNSRKTILERRDEKRQPYVIIADNNGDETRYYLPTGTHLIVANGAMVHAGDVIAKLVRQEGKSKDITGGLPRASELFEARVPSDVAVLAEVDGKVTFGGLHRGQRRLMVTTEEGEVFEYTVARSKHLNVEDGESVRAGDALTSGIPNIHDILRILGPDELQKYLVKEIQSIYTLQGVGINDKHIELIVRQMLKKVRIADPGDTSFIVGDRVDKVHLQMVNRVIAAEGKKIALSKPLLMGITKASLGTDSFISAASFQETTKVLTEAALAGQVDYLRCLKSNITIGKLIPAGTGIASFKMKYIGEDISEYERQARIEEQLEIGLDKISLT